MRMMKTLWPLCVAALALSLNGCGGGGNTRPAAAARAAPTPGVTVEEAMVSHVLTGEDAESIATALEAVVVGSDATTTRVDANNFTIGTSPNELHVTVTRTGEKPMVMPTLTGTDGEVDAAGDTTPDDTSLMMTDRKPPAAGNLHTARFVDEDESHFVNVYTDILPPGPKAFGDIHALNAHTDDDDEPPFEALTVIDQGDDHASLVDSGDEHSRPGTEYMYTSDDSNTDDVDEAQTFPGTLQGAPGTFRCDGNADCTVTTRADGALTFSQGWIFIPDPMAMAMVEDDDFLTFGYWAEIPGGEADWTFTPFSSGSMPYTEAAVSRVTGSARYDGSAAGGYVRRQYDPNGVEVPDSAEAGAFTAAVNLMAHFGGLAVTAANQFTIRGTVSNFVNADGGSLDGWTVTMNPADFSGRTNVGPLATEWPATPSAPGSDVGNSFTGTTSTGTGSGNWNGMFYGPSTAADASPKPTGVAGEFGATFSNGSVVGAYGATRPQM